MKKTILLITLGGFMIITPSCKKKGCTDSKATNYSSEAQKDDGSCVYPNPTNPSNTDNESLQSIELTGTQSSPIILSNRISDENIPDYIVSNNYTIASDVVIEPGVSIRMKNSSNIFVNQNGSLKAIGTASKRIKIYGEQAIDGYWGTIGFNNSNNPINTISYCDISHGGGNNSWDGIIYGYSDGQLNINNTKITNSSSYGINIYSDDFKLHSLDYTEVKNCVTPIRITPSQLGGIGNSVSGAANNFSRIEVNQGNINSNTNIKKCGFPYYIKNSINVSSALEIEEGNNLIFSSSGYFKILSSGSFKAIGSVDKIITFSGENSVAGSWGGIYFYSSSSTSNEIKYCNIGYGGNNSSWNALIYLYDNSYLTISNSTIHNSSSYGIMNYNNDNTLNNNSSNTFYSNASGDVGN